MNVKISVLSISLSPTFTSASVNDLSHNSKIVSVIDVSGPVWVKSTAGKQKALWRNAANVKIQKKCRKAQRKWQKLSSIFTMTSIKTDFIPTI